ncbi:Aste57867_16578 [Aphanomyces stellatus]|uniref:Aste57867_16578 protein n=1 Tax=Aphanomyces stellatus TaxID=120398 RepID=A0A485L701_9STRA|nr:hypothetical protein As57867_016521 [Aphanomyces stellatus]VFT93350.1 Aste57867_16578 [Aphanomyces stellatus]
MRVSALWPSNDVLFVASLAAGLPQANASAVITPCHHTVNPVECNRGYLGQLVSFSKHYLGLKEKDAILKLASHASSDVFAMQVSFLQYVRESTNDPLQILQYVFFDPVDPTFYLWSWVYMFEWATGYREVVSFEGDVGQMRLITEDTLISSQGVEVHELRTTFAMYACSGVQYVTAIMLGVASLTVFYTLVSRGRLEGMNLFELNRVAGIVWVGRPLLLLRGVTALCLLSTATLELDFQHHVSYFSVPPLPWYKTILGASEATWLVYILNDLSMVWTKEFTMYYATSSCLLVWLFVAILTLVQPVAHDASVTPQCQFDQMDFQLVCHSGVIRIGQFSRLICLLAIIGITNVACCAMAYWVKRDLGPTKTHSLFLSSGAKYLFDTTNWIYNGAYYIDPASALLNGLISWHWGPSTFMMDIKLWRIFCMDKDLDAPLRLQARIILVE